MEAIKKYPLGQLYNKPYEEINFLLLSLEDLKELASQDINSHVSQFHAHEFYTIFWVEKGYHRQVLDGTIFSLQKGDVFIISPGQVHENNFPEVSKAFQGGVILFTAKLIDQIRLNNEISGLTFLDNIFSNPRISLSNLELKRYLSIIVSLSMEIKSISPNWSIIKYLFSALLLSIQQAIDNSAIKTTSNRHIEVYKQFKYFLELHYKKNKASEFYADLIHISNRHLNRLLKETTSKTVAEIIRARSILEASRLLIFTDLTVSEIAGSLGYPDNSNFTKIFKKETGKTPQAYRLAMS